ncbi:hypothetical protein FOL47_002341 [Perkinsus chesapeaki]|uniref:Uncharacterized protein n=1 Tax=Perkinsus chesapeaki TaxID=330153 RepID=A0A7J6MEI2_PERCH|nr:hypothetical protein FOL47_002341 [Perkinsus chesapeaki]
MRFSSTWSVVVAQLALTTVTQPVGRYMYDAPNGQFTLGYDINVEKKFAFFIATSNFTFADFFYPLTQKGWFRYAINLEGTDRTVDTWYDIVLSSTNGFAPQTGDLTILTFTTYDSLCVRLGGRRLTLFRRAFPIQSGAFANRADGIDSLRINYTVQAPSDVAVTFRCGSRVLPPVSFILVQNDDSLRFRSYDLAPSSAVDALRRSFADVCPSCRIKEGDLTNIVFTYSKSLYITIGGRRTTLTMF